jgi:hypothetical protein
MAGPAAAAGAKACWSAPCERFDLPVHVHTHDTAGGQLATCCAAWQAGADAVDGAAAPDGGNHQPARAELDRRRRRAHRVRHRSVAAAVCDLEPYWEAVRKVYALRIRAARADGPGLPPRDSGWAAVQSAPAGDRAGPRRPIREGRRGLRRREPGPGQARSRSRRHRRWSATWRWLLPQPMPTLTISRPTRRSTTSPTR